MWHNIKEIKINKKYSIRKYYSNTKSTNTYFTKIVNGIHEEFRKDGPSIIWFDNSKSWIKNNYSTTEDKYWNL